MLLDLPTKGSPGSPTRSMTVIDDQSKKLVDEQAYSDAGPSGETAPLLGEGSSSLDREAVPAYHDLPDDLPPVFTHYHAEYDVSSSGDIFSHDRHLNEDGEALYRFLLAHASTPPNLLLRCRGTHPETRVRHVTRSETRDGRTVTRIEPETYTETVVDFDFSIDISHHLRQLPPVNWTVPDDEPAYRGGMSREVLTDTLSGVRRVPRRVLKAGKVWRERREKWGLPPWLSQADHDPNAAQAVPADESMPMRSELSLRQWADRYCASHKGLKEFTFRKVAYGWNFEQLAEAVRSTIRRVSYVPNQTVTVKFSTSANTIDIRPSTRFSRALSKTWVVVVLWMFLIYPFIWLYRRFRGGRWEVAGAAFPLRAWKHCEGSLPGQSVADYRAKTAGDVASVTSASVTSEGADDRILAESGRGVSQLVGVSEGDWFQTWESTIIHCVTTRVQESTALITPHGNLALGISRYTTLFPNQLFTFGGPSGEYVGFGHSRI
ncbi:hypothetical protein FRC06_001025 [Ceratobasidium sp. 370]|nr:hypothetical protein FRC06_001025 [Ceratobasidium sp. 370]